MTNVWLANQRRGFVWCDPDRSHLNLVSSLEISWLAWALLAAIEMAEAHYKPPGLEAWDIVIVVLYFIIILSVGFYVSIADYFIVSVGCSCSRWAYMFTTNINRAYCYYCVEYELTFLCAIKLNPSQFLTIFSPYRLFSKLCFPSLN